MNDMIGKKLGNYQIVDELGRGGMAVVYRAFQPSLNRYVAIKVLPPHLGFDREFVKRFQREALASAQLRHPNIVVVHDVGHQQGIYFIVMELLEGRTLRQIIEKEGALSVERAKHILQQVAAALDYAHENGFVHRDVKPANIFIGKDDHATLTDFGIAKAASEAQQLTRTGMLLGTPEYMSPEQAKGESIDYRSDLYALGVVLYQMLVGQVPFWGTTPHAVLHAVIYEPPAPLRQRRQDLPPAIEAVVLKAMDKRPERRYQSGAELIAALVEASTSRARRAPIPVQPTLQHTARDDADKSSGWRNPVVWIVAAVAVIVLGLLAVLTIMNLGGDEPGETPLPPTTAVAYSTQTRTATPDTIAASLTETAAVAGLPSPATASSTPEPATATEALTPEPSPVPTFPVPSLMSPAPDSEQRGSISFEWSYTGILGSEEAFQVLIWKEGSSEHPAAAQAWGNTQQIIDLAQVPMLITEGPGQYLWSVVVVQRGTDARLSAEAPPRRFSYLGPAAPPTATWTPTPAPTPCAFSPQGAFVGLWQTYRDELGCPLSKAPTLIQDAEQPFENGHMFWRQDNDYAYVVYEKGSRSGSYQAFSDLWSEGDPEYSCAASPPPGKVQPKRGFGAVWCNLGGANAVIGWGLGEEAGFGPGNGDPLVQKFQHGFIFRDSDGTAKRLAYVFFRASKTFVRASY